MAKAYHIDIENTRSRVRYLYCINPDITVTQIARRIEASAGTVNKYLIPKDLASVDVQAEVQRFRTIRPRISHSVIAQNFGISRRTVDYYLNQNYVSSKQGRKLYHDTEKIRAEVRQIFCCDPSLTHAAIAKKFGVSERTVYKYLKKVKRSIPPSWTDEEVEYLIKKYLEGDTIRAIAFVLKRNMPAVRMKARRLRLSRPSPPI